jgi:putative proteasome-type protease
MSYCLGIKTYDGLVMASDSRVSAGADQVNICQKMHQFIHPGERVFVILSSGSLSLTQSVITLLRNEFEQGRGLAAAPTMYDSARVVGDMVRRVSDLDRAALERDDFRFNVNLILGGQIKGRDHDLYLIYPQGNPLRATEDSPYLQIGESKYGRPILDRGIAYATTTVDEAAKYALLSIDATIRSNATVGPPIDLLVYPRDELQVRCYRRFHGNDVDLVEVHSRWEQVLRKAVHDLPAIRFEQADARMAKPGADAPFFTATKTE